MVAQWILLGVEQGRSRQETGQPSYRATASNALSPETLEFSHESSDLVSAWGWSPSYLNSYVHEGTPRFTAIWSSKVKGAFAARHGLTGSQYHTEFNKQIKSGFLTRLVTGYSEGSSARYAVLAQVNCLDTVT